MSRVDEVYKPALQGKKVPLLTLDNKWHRLFTQADANDEIKRLEEELNTLIKRQGKLNTESKDIKKLKKRMMDEIVEIADMAEQKNNSLYIKKLDDNRRLINECNEKLESYQDELVDLPARINEVNIQLMLTTMNICYDKLKENAEEIEETAKWITEMRIELKKKLIRKQEKERNNFELYSYMHDIFGAEVIEIFDMKYKPDPLKPSLKKVTPKVLEEGREGEAGEGKGDGSGEREAGE